MTILSTHPNLFYFFSCITWHIVYFSVVFVLHTCVLRLYFLNRLLHHSLSSFFIYWRTCQLKMSSVFSISLKYVIRRLVSPFVFFAVLHLLLRYNQLIVWRFDQNPAQGDYIYTLDNDLNLLWKVWCLQR